MSNIFGSPFDSWVTEQINVRQKALGKGAKITSEELQYFNSKTLLDRDWETNGLPKMLDIS